MARTATWNQKWVDGAKEVKIWVTDTFNSIVTLGKTLIAHADLIGGIVGAYTLYIVAKTGSNLVNKLGVISELNQVALLKEKLVLIAQEAEAEGIRITRTAESNAKNMKAIEIQTQKLQRMTLEAQTNVYLTESEAGRVGMMSKLLQLNIASTESDYRKVQALWATASATVEANKVEIDKR